MSSVPLIIERKSGDQSYHNVSKIVQNIEGNCNSSVIICGELGTKCWPGRDEEGLVTMAISFNRRSTMSMCEAGTRCSVTGNAVSLASLSALHAS